MDADNEIESLGGDETNSNQGDEAVVSSRRREQIFIESIRRNEDCTTLIIRGNARANSPFFQAPTNEEWEEIGRVISDNVNVEALWFQFGALNDDNISFLFGGLTASTSVQKIMLCNDGLSATGLRSMESFLQNSNLELLDLRDNNIGSDGFNYLLRALHVNNHAIHTFDCSQCGIESIQIDNSCDFRTLTYLALDDNNIDANACNELAKLLKGESTLKCLDLNRNQIGDEGVIILADALKNNTSLKQLEIKGNGISTQGRMSLLALVNDISTINATLHSNHTLTEIKRDVVDQPDESFDPEDEDFVKNYRMEQMISLALKTNKIHDGNAEATGRDKLIYTQLDLHVRSLFAYVQGVRESFYSQIDPLLFPEMLKLIGRSHGVMELYVALRINVVEVLETVNRKKCLQQRLEYDLDQVEQIRAELEAIEVAEAAM